MKPIPEDTGSFLAIRTSEPQLLYVDKTAYLHKMITCPGRKCYFLARPRRFGKSLMITTLKEIFDRPPALAMSQVERKDYAAPFAAAGKPIWLVGLSFERETRKFLAGAVERYLPA